MQLGWRPQQNISEFVVLILFVETSTKLIQSNTHSRLTPQLPRKSPPRKDPGRIGKAPWCSSVQMPNAPINDPALGATDLDVGLSRGSLQRMVIIVEFTTNHL